MSQRLVAVPSRPTLRVYLRRSKGDAEQTHSLDVQRAGCAQFADSLGFVFAATVVYVDDGLAGDNVNRPGVQRLLTDLQPGDIVICRDASRLGRDALDTAVIIRTVVRDRGARLYYYAQRREVLFESAIHAAMAVIEGTGSQTELENNRARTAEALQGRVRGGKLAGGRCFGYRNVQHPDSTGRRKNTVAVVQEDQATVVRQIFTWYAEGRGQVWIAKTLNAQGVPTASYGKRGTGSWAPSAIRSMLNNERYRGVYVHGRTDRPRDKQDPKGKRRLTVKADPSKIIRVETPEWRIVSEPVWEKVQARFAAQAHVLIKRGKGRGAITDTRKANPWRAGAPRHPLSGLGRCAKCGGPIMVTNTKRGQKTIQSYSCAYAKKRGETVCTVSIRQPRDVVEGAIVRHLLDQVLTPELIEKITSRVVELAQQEGDAVPAANVEEELARLRAEQKRLVRLLATLDDTGELEAEHSARTAKIRALEQTLAAAKAVPVAIETVKGEIAAALERLREGLVGAPDELGQTLRSLFQRLTFEPEGPHWAISGSPRIELPAGASLTVATPAGFEPAFSP
jgi:site-specific DNA recombinase